MVLGFIGIFLWGAIVKHQKSIKQEQEYAALRSSGPENVVKRFIWLKNHSNKIKSYIIDPEIRNTKKSEELETFGEYEGKQIKEGFISSKDPQAKNRSFPGIRIIPTEYANADNITDIKIEKLDVRQLSQNKAAVEVWGTFFPIKYSNNHERYVFSAKNYYAWFSLVCRSGQWYVRDVQWSTKK